MPDQSLLFERATAYAESKGIELARQEVFGFGIDGTVWRTSRHSVIKVFEREKSYFDELECYRRLKIAAVESIAGFAVPELIDSDDQLNVIEIKIVRPPFLLDFGKVYLDQPPPYWNDTEIMGQWHSDLKENFGDRTGIVLSLLRALQNYGIYYIDPKPGNIMFGDESDRLSYP